MSDECKEVERKLQSGDYISKEKKHESGLGRKNGSGNSLSFSVHV